MKISLNWIKDYIDLKDIPEKDLVERLTLSTCEVEGTKKLDEHINNTVIGEIVSIESHPNADKLKVCSVNIGEGTGYRVQGTEKASKTNTLNPKPSTLSIVCGGTNLKEGAKVVVALPGATVKWHGQEGWVEMKETEIRGVKSVGMICAAEELELPWLHTGDDGERPILVLNDNAPVGESIVEYFDLADTIFDIDQKSITHRADLFSHVGIASELGAVFEKAVKDGRYLDQSSKFKVQSSNDHKGINVRIEAKDAVKRYSALLIENITVTSSPLWMQNRLRSIGIRSINNVVDVTNYVMWEFGMPLHAFDADKIGKQSKTIRFAKRGDRVTSLDGAEHELTETMLIAVDGEGRTIDLPGIMGGKESEVDDRTTTIWLQAAVFDRIVIRKMSLALSHRTDASSLYERGVDPNLTLGALERTFELLKEMCPEAVLTQVFDEYPEPVKPKELIFEPETIQKQLGVTLSNEESKEILKRLGFSVMSLRGTTAAPNRRLKQSPSHARNNEIATPAAEAAGARDDNPRWNISIPTRRKDIHGFQDICEEVGRVYGYDRIAPIEHEAPLRAPIVPQVIQTREMFRDILVGSGSHEIITYIFWSERDAKWLSVNPKSLVIVQNPISEDLKYLRTSLLPGMLKTVELNQGRFDSCSLFEVGRMFARPTEEREQFACLISDSGSPELLFRKMVGVWEMIVRALKLSNECVRESLDSAKAFEASAWLLRSESVSLRVKDSIVGFIGLVKPKVLDSYGVKRAVVYLELDADLCSKLRLNAWEYKRLPQYPSVLRDLALVVDAVVSYSQVAHILSKTSFLNSHELFDIFVGKGVPEGKKSMAFHLEFLSSDRTLTSSEVDESLRETLNELSKELGVTLRT